MRYLYLLICLASLPACGGSEAPRASKPEAAANTGDVLFQDQRSALQKAAGVEDMVLDADAKRRAQMEAQE